MTQSDIIHFRLQNQQIAQTTCTAPDQVVAWLGAMQAQEAAKAYGDFVGKTAEVILAQ